MLKRITRFFGEKTQNERPLPFQIEGVLNQILKFLPAEDQLLNRRVCKTWKQLIEEKKIEVLRAEAFLERQDRAMKALFSSSAPVIYKSFQAARKHPYFQSRRFIELVNAGSSCFPDKKIYEAYRLIYLPNDLDLYKLVDYTYMKKQAVHYVRRQIPEQVKKSTCEEWFLFGNRPHPKTLNKESFVQISAFTEGNEYGNLPYVTANTIQIALSLLMWQAASPKKAKKSKAIFTSNETFEPPKIFPIAPPLFDGQFSGETFERAGKISIDAQLFDRQLMVSHTPYPGDYFGAAVKVPLNQELSHFKTD